MQEKDIIDRIFQLCSDRGWTVYRLAKESGITYSTLNTMLHKANAPSFSTLLKICSGLRITLAQFFEGPGSKPLLSSQELALLESWNRLSWEDRETVGKFMAFLVENGKK